MNTVIKRTSRSHPVLHRRRRLAAFVVVAVGLAACTDSGTSSSDSSSPSMPSATGPTATTEPGATVTSNSTSTSGTTEVTDTTQPAGSTPTTAPPVAGGGPRVLPAYADAAAVPLLDGAARYGGPATPTSLDGVLMTGYRQQQLDASAELAQKLAANGFVITDRSARFFHDLYEQQQYEYDTIFVTTDALYNAWHLVFSKVLRDTEEQVLIPTLGSFLTQAVTAARSQETQLGGGALAESASRVVAFFEAAATLLGVDVGAVSSLAREEVTLATDAAETTTSPITGFQQCELPNAFTSCVDYTQFLPRGHYTHSEALERYFRAMSELGQQAFYESDPASLRIGLLVSRLIVSDPALSQLWQSLYETTAFLVGVADDHTPLEAAAAMSAVGITDTSGLVDDSSTEAVGRQLSTTRAVGIDPENASVRVMGARAVLDSYLLDQLAWPNVGTDDDRRTRVSPLDIASVFGSALATSVQTDTGQPHYENYTTQLDKMREVVDSRTDSDWAGTVYDAWLYALQPQFAVRSGAYPDFMRTDAWAAKSLQTGFGSYTELKHDTILYAKQGTAGEGEGPEPPAYVPRHWVEPDPVTFGRLVRAAQLTRDGLDQRSLLSPANATLLDTFIELSTWLGGIAAGELRGEVAGDADNVRLGGIGSELELLWYQASDLTKSPDVIPGQEDDAALVSDIFRDSFSYLELGLGTPEQMLVLVPDGTGHFQLATGVVYSYHEFWRPVDMQRLTDEEWRRLLHSSDQVPPQPSWIGPIRVGGTVAATPAVDQEG